MDITKEDLMRVRTLMGWLFAGTQESELKKPYPYDRGTTVEKEYWHLIEALKKASES